jgi:hypothetical protein
VTGSAAWAARVVSDRAAATAAMRSLAFMMGSRRQVEHGLQLRINYIASHNRMIIYCLNGRHPRQEYDFLWAFMHHD